MWECGTRAAGSKNALSSQRVGSDCLSCVGWALWAFGGTFLRGHGWRHLWHGEASADFGFKPQRLCPRAHGQGHRLGLTCSLACAAEVTRMQQEDPSPGPLVWAKEWLFHAPAGLARLTSSTYLPGP